MKALINKLSLLLIVLALTSCGGGGGTGGSFQSPTGTTTVASLTATPATGTIAAFTSLSITVTAKNTDGTPAKDGTSVSAALTPIGSGTIGTSTAGAGSTATGTTIGGTVAFIFTSTGQAGPVHIVFSASATSGQSITTAADITVSGVVVNRLQLTATTLTIPVNPQPDVFPSPSSPYLAEVTITRRHQNGSLIAGTEKDNTSIAPTQIAAFSTLDDPTTPWTGETKTPPTAEGNEFLTEIGSGPVSVTGGQGTIFVHSQNLPGQATLIVTAIDPDTGETLSSSLTFTIVSTIPPVPASINLSADSDTVYTSTSGGDSSVAINAQVLTGAGASVADPVSGNNVNNNIQFDIVGPNPGGARLSAIDATTGQAATGTSVKTRTTSGIASVSFLAGTETGPIQVKATADRYDNSVDNGITDPITATITIVISDGQLYSLSIASPVVNGLTVNSVSGEVTTSSTTPGDPNATYSVLESATGVDRAGNPVLPGTVINFGLIDAPVSTTQNSGSRFLITSNTGDPEESNTLFTDLANGHFKTAGGGAGPGDTLLIFGHSTTFDGYVAPVGNRDLEGSRFIQSIASDTQLTVTSPFNPNDDTGQLTDNGPVIPYVIGHATVGNITVSATTNAAGVAAAYLTYPASHLGQYAYVWAQGTVVTSTGTKTVGEVSKAGYPGVAPAILSAPSTIVGNTTTTLLVCVSDALSQPIAQQAVGFAFENIGSGTATIDGEPAGIFQNLTDSTGCTVGIVVTSGLTNAGSAQPDVVISADGQQTTVKITVGGAPVLQASPSAFVDPSSTPLTLTLTDDHGNPIPGVSIVGVCTGTISLTTIPPTNAQGVSKTQITAIGLDAPITPLTGSCTFTAADGATAKVNVTGVNTCTINKNATGCPVPAQSTLTVVANDANVAPNVSPVSGSITISGTSLGVPVSQGCSISGTGSVSCPNSFDQNTTVTLTAKVPTPVHTQFSGWAGGCAGTVATGGTGGTSTLTVGTSAVTCTANFTCTGTCP